MRYVMDGRVCIVTGAASGIGASIAFALGRAGSHVILADRDKDRGKDVAARIQGSGSGSAMFWPTDVAKSDDVASLMSAVGSRHGSVDVLINAAGVGIFKSLEETVEAEWDRVMDCNLKSAYLCSKFVLPQLRTNGGVIVNIASVQGFASRAGSAAYAVSKAGLVGLTRQLAVEYAQYDIRVGGIAPATVDTPMFRNSLPGAQSDAEAKEWVERNTLRELIQPEDVAEVTLFMVSDAARFISGSFIILDGGILARLN